jgi:hypothetical protein
MALERIFELEEFRRYRIIERYIFLWKFMGKEKFRGFK